ncbi:hypothetical protein GCM10010909_11770 [Acidocella aquatica]|uniref:Uncharacterized protein n=1 Tax=Acidocella aquatica TaxID=1922313 RepID=A0ABQ6A499_9PROT|nr:hypothetical protein GCM10010909_11770 [Acidocella aquatica]
MSIEAVQIKKARFPTIPEIPPIENSTNAGTPLATQNAPFQSMERRNVPASPIATPVSAVISLIITPTVYNNLERGFELAFRPRPTPSV